MIPVLLLFVAMFIMITLLGAFMLWHLRDHEREQIEAEEFAQKLLDRFSDMIEERLSDEEEGS